MYKIILIFAFVVCFKSKDVVTLRLPGPQVYVVTPSSRPLQIDEGKSAPFYYQNWMRRMDTASESTSTTTTAAPIKTPDLIFAEFESDGKLQKSIRNLLEKEKIHQKTTTPRPIYVPDDETTKVTRIVNYGLPVKTDGDNSQKFNVPEMNSAVKSQVPVYQPSTTTTTTTTSPINIENIWHIIDNEKFNQQPGDWDEVPINSNDEEQTEDKQTEQSSENYSGADNNEDDDVKIDENFALPGFGTNPGSAAENESRAIHTGSNIRFPYVNLKPFQMKNSKKPLLNSKKTNMFSLDNFYELKEPVRGEAQDISVSQQIDRYNPAQPYLPKQEYGSSFSKQSSPVSPPVRATANLVPPPPPPPKITGNDFPSPATYESFPPYPPSLNFPSAPAPAPKAKPPSMNPLIAPSMEIPVDAGPDDSDDDSGNDDAVMDLGYRYKPPSAPAPQFLPTAPPPVKYDGYSYNKPSMTDLAPPVADKPDFGGYHYKKPEASPPSDDKPDDFPGYSYSKPDVPQFFDHKPSYGHDAPSHDSDYPELIFNKPHGDVKGGDDMKANDMGMMPPPAPSEMKPDMYGPPMDDHGFPSDFPGDFKFHHDFDDHDHDHHYHHTTTTTTEMPRVNRYSYYYLGKKLYYLPLYFSVYFIVYVGALIIKAVLRHKIVYPNSWRPNDQTASFFSKRSVDYLSDKDNLHELTGRVTHAIASAAEKYMTNTSKTK
ncbi:uncharacterized protein LOC121730696 [Aricia agestis]|uniref:uncharacterized protein LOC121730696 n=1 Tax=Aricia agestis TaxID=91739 RepID=UPI001C203689|nr:uncharacterized protein LOC121730696 [Aricia agestis]